METVLQYADPRTTQRRWGPFFFLPSIRSILLLGVFVGSFFWLRARHEPWVLVNRFNLPDGNERFRHAPRFAFTPDNHLLVAGPDRKVALYDSDGRKVRNVSTAPGYSAFLRSGTQVLLIREGQMEGVIVNSIDGSIVQRTANPFLKGHNIEWCNDDASRVLTHYSLLGTEKWAIWDLTRGEPTPAIKPIFEVSEPIYVPGNSDGSYLLLSDAPTILWLKDLKTSLRTIPPDARPVGCIGPYEVFFTGSPDSAWQPADKRLEVRTVHDGKRVLSVPYSVLRERYGGPGLNLTLSRDGTLLIIQHSSFSQTFTDVFDLRKGMQIGRRGKDHRGNPCFIPGTRQFIIDSSWRECILEDPSSEPLFVLSTPTVWHYKLASSDGTQLVGANGSEFGLWKRPGFECRLTRFGILGMPHAWLFLTAASGAVISLVFDARRRSLITNIPLWLSLPAAILAAAISLYMLLGLILGRVELTPAPLLLFVIIGLSLGSRFWRWISLFTLGACILWYANLLRLHLQLGGNSAAALKLFDTTYNLPRPLPLVILSAGSAVSLLLLLAVLLRRQKPGLNAELA